MTDDEYGTNDIIAAIRARKIDLEGPAPMSHAEMLRNKNPGLQELWERYQVMYKLCDDQHKQGEV